jgi:HSP20 family protein
MFDLMPRRKERDRGGSLTAREGFPFGPMDALFNRLFAGWPVSPWEDGGRTMSWGLDVEETDKEVIIRAEAPGFEAKDFEVYLNGDVLTIQAEHKDARGKAGEAETERRYARLRRTVQLPSGTEAEKVAATYRNGVLEMHLPRKPEAQGRRIEVK